MGAFSFALVAAFLWGCAAFCEKQGLFGAEPLPGVVARGVGVALGAFAVCFFIPQFSDKFSQMGWRSFLWLAGGGLLASVGGQIFFYRALKIGEIGRVASVGGSWPVFAFLLSILFLNEVPTPRKVLGVLLAVTGVCLLK